MNPEELRNLPVPDLLTLTQTNVTRDPNQDYTIATLAYELAETPAQKGIAARQAGFRAEQANKGDAVVEVWFNNSRAALTSDEPPIRRELIATYLLEGRAFALRVARRDPSRATKAVTLAGKASLAFEHSEMILQEQHKHGRSWDRFGTMLARHRAAHEAMNGRAGLAATTAMHGLWRAVRAKRQGTPEPHVAFVAKHVTTNALAGILALSKSLEKLPKVATLRQRLALRLLG